MSDAQCVNEGFRTYMNPHQTSSESYRTMDDPTNNAPADGTNTVMKVENGYMLTRRLEIFFDAMWGIFATIAGVKLAFIEPEEVCAVVPEYNGVFNCKNHPTRTTKTFEELLGEKSLYVLKYLGAFFWIVYLLWEMHNVMFYQVDTAKIQSTMFCHTWLAIFSALIPAFFNFGSPVGCLIVLTLCLVFLLIQTILMRGRSPSHNYRHIDPLVIIIGIFIFSVTSSCLICFILPENYKWVGYWMWYALILLVNILTMICQGIAGGNVNAARERERRRAAINRIFTYKKERVEAFTDGVIAIASTFIALELKVDDNADAGSWFVKHLDKILCMILTMFMLLNLWLIHHQIFSYLPEIIPSKLVLLNSLFCFSTTLIPLTTSFAFYFNEYKTAVALPCFVGLFASSMLAIIDWVGFRGQPRGIYMNSEMRWLFPGTSIGGIIIAYTFENSGIHMLLYEYIIFVYFHKSAEKLTEKCSRATQFITWFCVVVLFFVGLGYSNSHHKSR